MGSTFMYILTHVNMLRTRPPNLLDAVVVIPYHTERQSRQYHINIVQRLPQFDCPDGLSSRQTHIMKN